MAANKSKKETHSDDEPLFMTLVYEDGSEVETEVMGIFEVEGKEYIALIPDDDPDAVYLYGYLDTGDDEEIFDIEDEEEFERAVKEFDALMAAAGGEE